MVNIRAAEIGPGHHHQVASLSWARRLAQKPGTCASDHQPSEWAQIAVLIFPGLHWGPLEASDLWCKSGGSKETIWSRHEGWWDCAAPAHPLPLCAAVEPTGYEPPQSGQHGTYHR